MIILFFLQRMSGEPLGTNGLPPWDGVLIHYSCDPNRSDIVLRMSHMIADGHLILKLLRQITVPQDAAAKADYAVTVLGSSLSSSGGSGEHKHGKQQQEQQFWLLRAVVFLAGLVVGLFRYERQCASSFTCTQQSPTCI
jgi:hypothetical protein